MKITEKFNVEKIEVVKGSVNAIESKEMIDVEIALKGYFLAEDTEEKDGKIIEKQVMIIVGFNATGDKVIFATLSPTLIDTAIIIFQEYGEDIKAGKKITAKVIANVSKNKREFYIMDLVE